MFILRGEQGGRAASRGFTLVEVTVGMGIFLLFALGVYGGIQTTARIAQRSRMKIIQTAVLNEELEVAKNVTFGDVGILGGSPPGVLPYQKTVTRNGQTYQITTTVRNIDDPFDGTVASTTKKDTAPADYKLVEMAVVCTSCNMQFPVTLSTRVAPKGLESTTNNGSLFIHVFDNEGAPVPGASVRAVNYDPNPDLVINDVTDNSGYLTLIDVPTGTLAYNIDVSKPGYSSDYTVTSTAQNPRPAKLPSTVVSQGVTEISFSIDKLASATVQSLRTTCQGRGNIPVNLWGQKMIGTDPVVYKTKKTFTTDAQGEYAFPTIEADTYMLTNSSTAYDLAGTIPMLPVKIAPGGSQEILLIMTAHTTHSLLVSVKDAGTKLPLSDASVRLTKTGYDKTFTTSQGYTRQTDWSGGGGQADFTDGAKYWSDSGTIDRQSSPGDVTLKKTGGLYATSGWLESSTIDIGPNVTYRDIIFDPFAQPPQTGPNTVRLQLAASDAATPEAWEFVGPDGQSTSYYSPATTTIYSGHTNARYLRYRLLLATLDPRYTPQISELSFTYTTKCTPPGQVFFGGLASGMHTLTVTRAGYATSMGTIDVNGNGDTTVNMSSN